MGKIFKSQGVVFKSIKYSETSLILDIYSKDIGIHSYIVSGVRKSKSKLSNIFIPGNIIDYIAYASDEKLSRIKEGQLAYRYNTLQLNIIKSSIAIYYIDLARSVIKERESNFELYNFICNSLKELDQRIKIDPNAAIKFSTNLAKFLGFGIYNNYSSTLPYFDLSTGQFIAEMTNHSQVLNIELSLALASCLSEDLDQHLSKDLRNKTLDSVIKYYKTHISGFSDLKSLSVLRKILS